MKIGFWSEKNRPKDWIDKSWKKKLRKQFLRRLEYVESTLAQSVAYKGSSECRICHKRNGSIEFKYKRWKWPIGFSHYIRKHKLKPSKRFRKFIKQETLQYQD